MSIVKWFIENYQWLFSGAGGLFLLAGAGWFINYIIKVVKERMEERKQREASKNFKCPPCLEDLNV